MMLQHLFLVCLMLLALIIVSESTHRGQRVNPKCGQGWHAYGKVKCFKLIEAKLSQEEGAERCAGEGTSLAKIANKVEQRFITREYLAEIRAANPEEEVSVWTDGKRSSSGDCEDGFKWEDGIEIDVSMVPTGRDMGKDCLTLVTRTPGNESNLSQWLAHHCEEKADYVLCEKAYPLVEKAAIDCRPVPTPKPTPKPTPRPRSPFVCKGVDWLPANDGCFKGLATRREPYAVAVGLCDESVSAAEVHSHRVSSRLASIKTAQEQAKLKAMLDSSLNYDWFGREYWLGARRVPGTSRFRWNDGSEMSWSNWASNEPKSSDSGDDCVAMGTYNYIAKWRTTKCNYGYIPLCQKIQE